jgi:hypothetical protein
MSELHSFLDSAIADIRSRLEQEYQRRLEAHEAAIGEGISPADFTADYEKIVVDVELLRKLNLYSHHDDKFHRTLSSIVPAGRWAIHSVNHITRPPQQYHNTEGIFSILDNHGEWYLYSYSARSHGGEYSAYFKDRTPSTSTYPYRMPNVLIDFCKTLKEPIDVGSLVEHYHKQFMRTKPLFVSGKLAEYAVLQEEKAAVEKELEKTRADLKEIKDSYEQQSGMIYLSFTGIKYDHEFQKEEIVTLKADYDKYQHVIDAMHDLCCDNKLVSPEINCIHRAACVIDDLTESKEKQQKQMKELREIIIANEQQIRDLKKKSADTQTQLRTTTTELATVTEQVKQLREDNQRYVDMAFQQRQDIIKYKKELLRLDPATTME